MVCISFVIRYLTDLHDIALLRLSVFDAQIFNQHAAVSVGLLQDSVKIVTGY